MYYYTVVEGGEFIRLNYGANKGQALAELMFNRVEPTLLDFAYSYFAERKVSSVLFPNGQMWDSYSGTFDPDNYSDLFLRLEVRSL